MENEKSLSKYPVGKEELFNHTQSTKAELIKRLDANNLTIQQILKRIYETAKNLAEEVEKKEPWHPFGAKKMLHEIELEEQVSNLARLLKLNSYELSLLKIIMLSHDLGRFIEALEHIEKWKRPTSNHAEISVDILQKNNLLVGLPQKDKKIIYFAVKWHAAKQQPPSNCENELSKNECKLAIKLTHILKDLDKIEIIENLDKYLSPQGIKAQVYLHYPHPEEIINENSEPIIKKIHPEALKDFEQFNLIDRKFITFSHPTYILFQLALIFDIKNPELLIRALDSPGIKARLKRLKKYIPKEQFEKIKTTIQNFINKKLDNTTASTLIENLFKDL